MNHSVLPVPSGVICRRNVCFLLHGTYNHHLPLLQLLSPSKGSYCDSRGSEVWPIRCDSVGTHGNYHRLQESGSQRG